MSYKLGHNALGRYGLTNPAILPSFAPMPMTPQELKRHLQRTGLSQTETARRLKVNARTVRRWIAGDSPIPEAVALLVPTWPSRKARKPGQYWTEK